MAENLESLRVPSGIGSLNLFLRHIDHRGPPVLILHGATFPSGNAAAWKIDGKSWMHDLAEHGYDVYSLDFLGYGESDNYPEMVSEDASGPALGDVTSMVGQVDRAMAAISSRRPGTAIHLIAHSAGTLVAARYAELHPDRIARLVLFGAPAPVEGPQAVEVRRRRYIQVSAADQLNGFERRVRESRRLDPAMFSEWSAAYLATDTQSATRVPASVRVPAGMVAALDELDKTGKLPYDPARITTPTLVIQGEWDAVTPPAQGMWLFERLGAPLKRFIALSQGGHRLHLEQSRLQLYREVRGFLETEG
ncbi:MAG TPA: alpha/beta fold hydrolase [Steroidobacter sp.]|uniref:alpha/beta hydrolase n=1 Tax=Steroidobacter sp. TaxID=1978227 RepID=UPI002ED7CDF0